MKCTYNNIKTRDGKDAVSFDIVTRKGSVRGLYLSRESRIFVHHAMCQNGLKGIMNILVRKFKTRLVTFTPLITDAIPLKIKGIVKTMIAENPDNPYGEDFKYMEVIWENENI